MILASDLTRIIELTHEQLNRLVRVKHKKYEHEFESSKFLGLTTGGEFCFSAKTKNGRVEKLFVQINGAELEVSLSQ